MIDIHKDNLTNEYIDKLEKREPRIILWMARLMAMALIGMWAHIRLGLGQPTQTFEQFPFSFVWIPITGVMVGAVGFLLLELYLLVVRLLVHGPSSLFYKDQYRAIWRHMWIAIPSLVLFELVLIIIALVNPSAP